MRDGPRRRVDRHRYAAGQQNAQERGQQLVTGGQHQRHALAALEPAGDQSLRHRAGVRRELRVGQRALPAGARHQQRVDPLAVPLDVPGQDLGQGAGAVGLLQRARGGRQGGKRRRGGGRACRSAPERAGSGHQVGGRLGLGEQRLGKMDALPPLDAQQQLGERQAVEPELAVEQAVELDPQAGAAPRLQLAHQLAEDLEDRFFERPRRRRARGRGQGRGRRPGSVRPSDGRWSGVRHRVPPVLSPARPATGPATRGGRLPCSGADPSGSSPVGGAAASARS
jgi:hypothetical protein